MLSYFQLYQIKKHNDSNMRQRRSKELLPVPVIWN